LETQGEGVGKAKREEKSAFLCKKKKKKKKKTNVKKGKKCLGWGVEKTESGLPVEGKPGRDKLRPGVEKFKKRKKRLGVWGKGGKTKKRGKEEGVTGGKKSDYFSVLSRDKKRGSVCGVEKTKVEVMLAVNGVQGKKGTKKRKCRRSSTRGEGPKGK